MYERFVPCLDTTHLLLMAQVVLLAADLWHVHGTIIREPRPHVPEHSGWVKRLDLRVRLGKMIVLACTMQQAGDTQATAWMPLFGLDLADFHDVVTATKA